MGFLAQNIYTHPSGESLAQIISTMAARTTRQSLTELRDAIKNDKKDIVVIPSDLFMSLMTNHAEAQEKFIQVTENVNETLKQLSVHTEKSSEALASIANSQENFQLNILEKLDKLSSAIKSSGIGAGTSSDDRLKQYSEKRKELLGKTLRAEKLSEYYAELLQQDNPFVPREYRTKIGQSTPQFEMDVHKESAIHRVNTQIKLMEGRIRNWRAELEKLETEATKRMQDMDACDRDNFVTTITEVDEMVKKERTKSFDKLKQTYVEEMNNGYDDPDSFLLTFTGKANRINDRSSKKQNRHPQSRGRGKRWQRPFYYADNPSFRHF